MSARVVLMAVVMVIAAALPAAAQEPPLLPDTVPAAVPDTLPPTAEIPREHPSPRAAFLRAMVVPGWGHFGMGEYRRGAVYAALQGTSWFMLGKSIHRLGEVRDVERALTVLARDSLEREMEADPALRERLENPVAYDSALVSYPGIQDARNLGAARQRHRQDWIVYTAVLTFAGAIDAYVTAHLREFPAEITVEPARGGGTALGLRVPTGRKR